MASFVASAARTVIRVFVNMHSWRVDGNAVFTQAYVQVVLVCNDIPLPTAQRTWHIQKI